MDKRKLKEVLGELSVKLDFLIDRQGKIVYKTNALGAKVETFVSGAKQFSDYILDRINKQNKDGKSK